MATKVHYVSSSDGIKVRKEPAGAYLISLPLGNLMYEKSSDYVEAELNGTTYTWVNVHYYHENGTEGNGWVAKENTFAPFTTATFA